MAVGSNAILVVEDEPAVFTVLAKMLRHGGYRALEARSVEAARKTYREHQTNIGLVIADAGAMGIRTVVDRFAPETGVPFLYISGYGREELVRRGLLSPDANFLQKPFDQRRLLFEVERTLSRADGRARAAEVVR